MICPSCHCNNNIVLDCRIRHDSFWRKRKCVSCGNVFDTYERYYPDVDIKKNGAINGKERARKEKALKKMVEEVRKEFYEHSASDISTDGTGSSD